jgi:hypothetical protein
MRVCQTRHILNLCRSKHHHVVARHRFDRLGADPPGLNSDSSRDTHFTTAPARRRMVVPLSTCPAME